eukprot:8066125-Alexandrium_andersonii.AAC.1
MCIRDSTLNRPNNPLHDSESAKVGDPHSAGPDARSATLRATLPAPCSEGGGLRLSPTPSRGEC